MNKKKSKYLKKQLNNILLIPEKITNTRVAINAGNTAFMIILSLIPFLIFTIIIIKYAALSERMLLELLYSLVPSSFGELLNSPIKKIVDYIYRSPSPSFVSITTITAIWLCSRATLAIITGLNEVYEYPTLNYIPSRLRAILYILLLAITVLLTLVSQVFGDKIISLLQKEYPPSIPVTDVISNLKSNVGFIGLFLVFTVMYRYIPNHQKRTAKNAFMLEKIDKSEKINISFLQQMPGALFAATFWWLFSHLFSLYLNYNNIYASFYGTMATIAILMVWLYFCMYAFFIGGLVNAFFWRRYFSLGTNLFTVIKKHCKKIAKLFK